MKKTIYIMYILLCAIMSMNNKLRKRTLMSVQEHRLVSVTLLVPRSCFIHGVELHTLFILYELSGACQVCKGNSHCNSLEEYA